MKTFKLTEQLERMDQGFSVFNSHVNDAGNRADAEFILQFGIDKFNKKIKPFHDKGIMSIFTVDRNKHTLSWVTLVTAFVNENRV